MTGDTIFALSSAPGRAGIAVFRLSGPAAGRALQRLAGRGLPPPRRAVRARLRHPASGETLDDGLCLWFPGPASFTGEDVAELHVHGGRAGIDAVTGALAGLPGLRLAEPGEFTRRAFEHGKMDLTAAEGVADLVAAETAAQHRQALRQMAGELGALYDGWRARLVRLLAHGEAAIDFADEDVPATVTADAAAEADGLIAAIAAHLDDARRGERLRDGVRIAILGAPNVGKSSLLNRLARRDAAIVSPVAGTTRDVIEVALDLAGYPVAVADTAGLRAGGDEIEREGVRRAHARAAEADLRIVMFAADAPAPDAASAALLAGDADAVPVVNKIDLAPGPATLAGRAPQRVSARTGAGFGALLAEIGRQVARRFDPAGAPALTRARHRAALEACLEALRRARTAPLPELAAEDYRLAARALGRITGRVDVEELLDVVFRDFCIGK